MTLREKVARALCTDDGNPCGCATACKIGLAYADKAIALVRRETLEEAAKECESARAVYEPTTSGYKALTHAANAIRDLKEKT